MTKYKNCLHEKEAQLKETEHGLVRAKEETSTKLSAVEDEVSQLLLLCASWAHDSAKSAIHSSSRADNQKPGVKVSRNKVPGKCFTMNYEQWRRQLWGTGARAPLD